MATSVIKNRPFYLDAIDFSNSVHSLSVEFGVDDKDGTVLINDTHIAKAGLKSFGCSMDGYWDETTEYPSDSTLFENVGEVDRILTYATGSGAVGEVAYFIKMGEIAYTQNLQIGEMYKFKMDGNASGELVRGVFELNLAAALSSNVSSGAQLGALSSSQSLWAAIHVLGVSGSSPTLDVVVESDDNGSFTSAISRITFAQITDKTSQMLNVAGAISDDYWRINYTIGGAGPSFQFVVVFGIL